LPPVEDTQNLELASEFAAVKIWMELAGPVLVEFSVIILPCGWQSSSPAR